MDELAEQVLDVMAHYGLKRIIALGVGAGANILCRFSLAYPDKVCKLEFSVKDIFVYLYCKNSTDILYSISIST